MLVEKMTKQRERQLFSKPIVNNTSHEALMSSKIDILDGWWDHSVALYFEYFLSGREGDLYFLFAYRTPPPTTAQPPVAVHAVGRRLALVVAAPAWPRMNGLTRDPPGRPHGSDTGRRPTLDTDQTQIPVFVLGWKRWWDHSVQLYFLSSDYPLPSPSSFHPHNDAFARKLWKKQALLKFERWRASSLLPCSYIRFCLEGIVN